MKTLVKLVILVIFSLTLQLAYIGSAGAWCYPYYICHGSTASYGISGYGEPSYGGSGYGRFASYISSFVPAGGDTQGWNVVMTAHQIMETSSVAMPFKLASMGVGDYNALLAPDSSLPSPFAAKDAYLQFRISDNCSGGDLVYGAEVLQNSDYATVLSSDAFSTFTAFYDPMRSYDWNNNTFHFFVHNDTISGYEGDVVSPCVDEDVFESNKIVFHFTQEEVEAAYAAALSSGAGKLNGGEDGTSVVLVKDDNGNVKLEIRGVYDVNNKQNMDPIIATDPETGDEQNIGEIIGADAEDQGCCKRLRRRLRRLQRRLHKLQRHLHRLQRHLHRLSCQL
jgi:hypothetical protein